MTLGPNTRLRIIVLGYLIRGPVGGLAWHHLQYVMGLVDLGHDAYFLEDSDDYPSCYDPIRDEKSSDPSYGLEFAKNVFDAVGLGERWAYYDAHTARWRGPCTDRIRELCRTADLLLNLSGINPIRPWFTAIPARALVDTDPVFTQVRHLTDPEARRRAHQHTAFLSFGENIGRHRSRVPDDGLPWQATRQPIALDAWPVSRGRRQARFTTVMLWDSYPAQEYGGVLYGLKSHSFGPYLDLPQRVGRIFELAVGGPTAPRHELRRHGWRLQDPRGPGRDPWTYRRYIEQSKAEFSVAKHGYVVSGSGWFSERSACYLASGRPVVVQDTGFTEWLEAGAGVIAFRSPDEAVAGLEEINRRYEFHCRTAREVAAEYFDARRVIADLLRGALGRNGAIPAAAGATDATNRLTNEG